MEHMINIFNDLNHLSPEVLLFVGTMVTLLTASFCKKKQYFASIVLSLTVVICALVLLYFQSYNYFSSEVYSKDYIFASMLCVDRYSVFWRMLILLSGLCLLFMMMTRSEQSKKSLFEMPILVVLSLVGMMLMVGSVSLISLYMSMEIMSLPLYIMAASRRTDGISSEAGMKYFILGSLSSGLYLFGASLIYGFTGQLAFESIYRSIDNTIDPALLFGVVFIITSFCFKISAVPFHMWAPDVYQGSPTIVTAFFASVPKIAAFALLGRLLFNPFFGVANQWQQILIFVSIASILIGSLGAIMQKNFKRLLAYSSIGHMGFALAGYAAGDDTGLISSLIYILIYITMTIAIFACLLMLKRDGKEVEAIYELKGLATDKPCMAFAVSVLMFSMAGVPPMAGFFAKFAVLNALVANGMFITAIIFVVGSIIAAYYYLNVIKIMYFDKSEEKMDKGFEPVLVVVAVLGVAFNLLYSLNPSFVMQISTIAVESFSRLG